MIVQCTWVDGDGDIILAFAEIAEGEDGLPFIEVVTNDHVSLDSSIGFADLQQLRWFRDMLTDYLTLKEVSVS